MASDEQTDPEDLARIQTRLAATNSEIAAALKQTASFPADQHPEMALRNAHRELLDAYQNLVQTIDYVERTLDADPDNRRPTPRQIKRDHAERLEEQYDEPVVYVAMELLERNRREWLHRKPDTNGGEAVERHGLTANQREWLNELQAAWREYDDE